MCAVAGECRALPPTWAAPLISVSTTYRENREATPRVVMPAAYCTAAGFWAAQGGRAVREGCHAGSMAEGDGHCLVVGWRQQAPFSSLIPDRAAAIHVTDANNHESQ